MGEEEEEEIDEQGFSDGEEEDEHVKRYGRGKR